MEYENYSIKVGSLTELGNPIKNRYSNLIRRIPIARLQAVHLSI